MEICEVGTHLDCVLGGIGNEGNFYLRLAGLGADSFDGLFWRKRNVFSPQGEAMKFWIGFSMLTLFFSLVFRVVVDTLGWRGAFIVWGGALAGTALFIGGLYLMVNDK